MSRLKVNQIKTKLLTMFEQHLDLNDLGQNDTERELKVLTRCLAAFAIYYQTGCTEEEAALSVWDGADDNGVDAAYFDPSETRVVFVQSKWIQKGTGEPEAKDIGVFLKGVKDAIEQDQTGFHQRLHARFNDIALRLSSPGTYVHLVLVSTGVSKLARHGNNLITGALNELNGDDPDALVSSEVMGLTEVYTGLANDPSQSNVTLDATILEWSYVSNPYPAYFGIIDGLQLKGWWKKHGKGLVAKNIRHSLGTTEVNNEIKNTATKNPEKFWYFNNGITLVADEKAKAPVAATSRAAGVFSFKGASIVNGAQTVSSLAKVEDDASLGNVRVFIRVILLSGAPEGFGSEVTRTNNLQNRVEPRDFAAQDQEQARIRQEMAIEGIDYQFLRSEDVVPTTTTCELLEVTTALACATADSNLAVQVKSGIGRFFADLSKPPYKTIFNSSTSGARAFNATLTLRTIESWIERKKKELAKKSGVEWGTLVHGNRILASAVFSLYGKDKLSQPISGYLKSLNNQEIDDLCSGVHSKMVDHINKHFSGKVLAALFKNQTNSKQVFDAALVKENQMK